MTCTIKKTELEAAFKIAAAISKPKTLYGEWFLLEPGVGFVSQGISVRVEMPMRETKLTTDKLLLHERTMRDLLPTLEGDLTIDVERNGLKLQSGTFKSKLHVLDATNYPTPQFGAAIDPIKLPLAELQAAVKDVEFAIANEVDRAAKAAFAGLTLKAADGVMQVIGAQDQLIAIAKLTIAEKSKFEFTLPREVATVIGRLAGDSVIITDLSGRGRQFYTEATTIKASLITAKLPSLEPITNRPRPNQITVNREDMRRAIRQIQVFKDRNSRLMTLKTMKDGITLSAISQTAGKAQAKLAANHDGDVTLGLDIEYVSTILDKLKDEMVRIEVGAQSELIAMCSPTRTFVTICSAPDKDFED